MTSPIITSSVAASTDALFLASSNSNSPPTTGASICSICRYPSWTEEVREEYEIQCDSFEDLRSSAESGCPGCEVMKQAWDWGAPDDDDRNDENVCFNISSNSLHFHLFTKRGVVNLDLFTLEHSPRFKHIRVATLIPPSTNLDINCDQVRQWILHCEQQHSSCGKNPVSTPLRLLDLKMAAIGIVHIVEVNMDLAGEHHVPPVHLRYACLSHCWGNSRSKHLTKRSNLDTNMSGIPVAGLPRTFRDAVEVSQALDIRYLWIDSLCIVQDDDADWETHVELMADIYRNAYITLAAGTSEDDEGGFFRTPEEKFTKLKSFVVNDDISKFEIYMRRCLPHPDEEWPAGTEMPLMSRGWVFQERLLSRRFLCFARNEILWECQEDVACSCSTSEVAFNHRFSGAKPGFLNCSSAKFDFGNIFRISRDDLWSLWRQLLSQYTERQLTYPSDKLPALAGLAAHFEAAGAGKYLYGLWLEALETHLLWENHGFSAQEYRPRKAPSWSWVSAADGGIDWGQHLLPNSGWQIISMPKHDIATEGSHYDPVVVSLKVRGNISQVSLELRDVSDMQEAFPGYRSVNLKIAPTTGLPINPTTGQALVATNLPSPELIGATTIQRYRGAIWTDYKFWTDETSLWNSMNNIFFLEIGIEEDLEMFACVADTHCWVAGLLLRCIEAEENGTIPSFERISWLRFCTETSADQWKPLGNDITFLFM
jgi:hypothetical protein